LGGVARRATVINQARAQDIPVLVLDAGDSLTGDQDPARASQGRTSIAVMNLMGYHAMVLGSQDLALGLQTLRQRMMEARFPLLSADAIVSSSNQRLALPYIVRQLGAHRVAIVGLSGGAGTDEITLADPVETAKAVLLEVASQADVIILLSHAGLSVNQQIADTVPDIDLIISGGNRMGQTPWRSAKTGTLILHADASSPGHAGRRIGVAHLSFDGGGQLVAQKWQTRALGPEIPADPQISAWVQAQQ
jgi:2',3'-cyclic-nucleotide 2'-phosphodiesterase (5'-nucleotidase family)